ncbi:glycosyl family 43 [Fusarium albosuccineum]|uniref:Glycosyl family 43 n=1 Tax=Fusarium albosuccineum TaxID=1237068 RepID=A0A8H4L1B9_9HYPO|nr:glycosyl family 43 [Fusarium albosuccineum]
MGDPLSVTASVIAVANLALKSCQALQNTISSFKNAPKTVKDLQSDLSNLQKQLDSLHTWLNSTRRPDGDQNLIDNQQELVKQLKPALQGCQEYCDDFTQRLSRLTSKSDTDRVDWKDKARLHFHEDDISLLKSRLGDYKQTLGIALSITTLKQANQNQDGLHGLETQIATTMDDFSGQIKGIKTAVQTLSLRSLKISPSDVQKAVKVLNNHDRMLKQCLNVCTSALATTTARSGTTVKYARTFAKAKQVVGNVGNVGAGGPATDVEYGEARGDSQQVIGNIEADAALKFLLG